MKELSIAGKATRYDKALKEAVIAHKDEDRHLKATLERVFPELKESEDEKIRKSLSAYFAKFKPNDMWDDDFSFGDIVTWLEKQGKNNMSISEATKQELEDNLNKALEKETPKSLNEFLENQDEQKPAWSEEDELHIRELESLVKRVWAIAEHENDKDTIHEMSDLSFFLKTLKPHLKQGEQKPWSEEDDDKMRKIINIIKDSDPDWEELINWFQFLKDRYTWKPSDEQMRVLDLAIRCGINRGTTEETTLVSLFNDLKKLKE